MADPGVFGEGLPVDLRARILRRARLNAGEPPEAGADLSAEAAAWLAAGSFARIAPLATPAGDRSPEPGVGRRSGAVTLAGLRAPAGHGTNPHLRPAGGGRLPAATEDDEETGTDAPSPAAEIAAGSAIVNAAFLPGWPPPLPLVGVAPRRSGEARRAETDPAPPRLRSAGSLSALIARLAARLGAARRRLEALTGLGLLYASILAVMDALAGERERDRDEEEDRLRAIGLGGRERIEER